MFHNKHYRSARLGEVHVWLGELCQVPFEVAVEPEDEEDEADAEDRPEG